MVSKLLTPSLLKRMGMRILCLIGFCILFSSGLFLSVMVIMQNITVLTFMIGARLVMPSVSMSMSLSVILALSLELFLQNKGIATA